MQYSFIRVALFCAVLIFCIGASAQRFSFDPSKSLDLEYYKDDYASNQITITNLTNESLSFRWRLLSNTFSSGWSFSFCDLGSCFIVPPDSNDMNPTSVGGDAYFICHTQFKGVVDSGALVLFVFEIGDEANGDTVTFRYTTTSVVGMVENGLGEYKIKLFPNPAVDVLYLNIGDPLEILNIEIYNSIGKSVYYAETKPGAPLHRMPIDQLASGNYYVGVLFENGKRKVASFYKTR